MGVEYDVCLRIKQALSSNLLEVAAIPWQQYICLT